MPIIYGIGCHRSVSLEKLHIKHYIDDIGILEIKIIEVEKSKYYPEGVKYSLVFARKTKYGFDAEYLRYDNHNKEGHHKHVKGKVFRYVFTNVETLVSDFISELQSLLREKDIEIDLF